VSRLEELLWTALHVAGLALGLANMSCGDDWPRAIDIGVTVGRDAGVVCVEAVDGGFVEVDCPDGGGE
jgi:hypothetical protein